MAKTLLKIPVALVALPAIAWASFALWFDGPATRELAAALALGFALLSLAVLLLVRPFWRAIVIATLAFCVVLAWWSRIPASNERPWMADVKQLPTAEIRGSLVTLRNVRNFDYGSETDFTPRWEERTVDLDKLQGAEIFLCYWGSPSIAHTIVSWPFSDGQHLAISIETRKEEGESYSAVRGFFRQYEIYYVVADERDVIALRTNHRAEDVYLYRVNLPLERARAVLLDYLEEINHLARQPRWYNAFTHNCTTAIRQHVLHTGAGNPWDYRILLNGYIDQFWYERGTLNTSVPFEELRKRSNIVARAKAADQEPDFSARIREGLP